MAFFSSLVGVYGDSVSSWPDWLPAGNVNTAMKLARQRGRKGNSLVEVTLLAPWLFFLFVGVLDFGFYAYSFISTENAARAAALLTSRSTSAASDQLDACQIVKSELQWASYGRTFPATCNSAPLIVTATWCHSGGACTAKDGTSASEVSVTYTTVTMIPIPGVLASQFAITRTVQMKVDPSSD